MQEAYYLHRGGYKCTITVNAPVTSHMTLHGYHFCCFNFQLRLAAPQRSLHPFRDRRLCFHDLLSLRGGGDDQRRRGKDKFGECQFLLFIMATHPAHCRQQQQNLNRKRSPPNGALLQHWQWRRWNRVAPLHGSQERRRVVRSSSEERRKGKVRQKTERDRSVATAEVAADEQHSEQQLYHLQRTSSSKSFEAGIRSSATDSFPSSLTTFYLQLQVQSRKDGEREDG